VLYSVFDVILVVSLALLAVVFVKILFFVSLSARHHARHRQLHPVKLKQNPLVSILVPSYNEGLTLYNCIDSLLRQTYRNSEIVIINDGSTDNTLEIARKIAKKYAKVRVIDKPNGGKASALNAGITQANGEIVVSIDADSMFMRNTVEQLVLSFHDPKVAAVGGNVKVANRGNVLARQQALEYITGLTLQRSAFSHLGCMQVISGAIGAFRRDALLAVGGYAYDTIVEDMDVTIELANHGYKVAYNPEAIAYTEAPETLHDFLKQRYRWTYGSFQVLTKHRQRIWHPSSMGYLGMPYFMIFPWVEVIISGLFFTTLYFAAFTGHLAGLAVMCTLMLGVQTTLIMYALFVDKEDKKLTLLSIIDSFFYYHLISFTTLRAGINYLRKKEARWNKLQRYGKNVMPLRPTPTSAGAIEGQSTAPAGVVE
jgi:poly-beta-1,6 N-acetyl-D-glucosamine synthase